MEITLAGFWDWSILVFVAVMVILGRFFPRMKADIELLMVFTSIFCLIVDVGYWHGWRWLIENWQRVLIIGCNTTLSVCCFIWKAWAGEDLHNLVAANIDKLGDFFQGFGDEYLKTRDQDGQANTDKSFPQEYRSVLTSKDNEENMLPVMMPNKIQEVRTKISSETGKAMKELASSIKTMKWSSSVDTHIAKPKDALEPLTLLKIDTLIKEGATMKEINAICCVTTLLADVAKCTEKISESVQELASLADFKNENNKTPEKKHLLHRGKIQPISDGSHCIITIDPS